MKTRLKTVKDFSRLAKRVSLPALKKKLEEVFNRFIRLRDQGKGCISCVRGAVAHAGHFYPKSVCPQASMRFCEENVHGQCVTCNSFQEGNREGYKKGLLNRYGQKYLENLEIKKSLPQNPWTAWQYQILIQHYKDKVKTVTEKDLL